MSYKLICMDMDGTLLNDEKEISEENKKAIREASEAGVKIAVCTGRIFTSAKHFAKLIGVDTPIIASNGAYIREKDREEIIYKSTLGYDNSIKLLEIIKEHDVAPHFYTHDTVFAEGFTYAAEFYAKVNETLPEGEKIKLEIVQNWEELFREKEDEILKGIGIDEDTEKISNIKEELYKVKGFEVVSSHVSNFEVMANGASKGKAAGILGEFYGINKDEILCIGDSENDLSMIKFAGLGIAMGNAEDRVKEVAKYITDTNNNNGVAKAIKKFVLAK